MGISRCSGVLAHPTSFPSAYGIGDLGPGAYEFLDFLHDSRQSLWQVLPLVTTSYGDSPYQSFSTFAGNTLLISPELLLKDGYLREEDLQAPPQFDPRRVDYGPVIEYKESLYRKAFARAEATPEIAAFYKANSGWLEDFALFTACKGYFIGERRAMAESGVEEPMSGHSADFYYGAVWSSWPSALRDREPKALKEWRGKLAGEIEYIKFLQYIFFNQWKALRDYAKELEIKIIGDIPIFVALDSADVWAGRKGFLLDAKGFPTVVAGVPPDYFSRTGQLWGNPIYDWDVHRRDGFGWWIERMRSCLELYDIIRIDHFRGFDEYWAVEYGAETAECGEWRKGPGTDLFRAIEGALGELPIIAEDLGVMTDTVIELRDSLGFPGMRILQFAFDDTPDNIYLPHNFESPNTVVYTGTHDNDTTAGWYSAIGDTVRDRCRRYMNVSGEDVAWDLIRLAFASTAAYAVVPVQDLMSLDSGGRMNTPGTAAGNWQFRYTGDMLNAEISERLRYMTEMFNRV